jgi:ATP adenylyltransferase
MNHRIEGCIFCHPADREIIAQNELAFATRDTYPVTPLHTLL